MTPQFKREPVVNEFGKHDPGTHFFRAKYHEKRAAYVAALSTGDEAVILRARKALKKARACFGGAKARFARRTAKAKAAVESQQGPVVTTSTHSKQKE